MILQPAEGKNYFSRFFPPNVDPFFAFHTACQGSWTHPEQNFGGRSLHIVRGHSQVCSLLEALLLSQDRAYSIISNFILGFYHSLPSLFVVNHCFSLETSHYLLALMHFTPAMWRAAAVELNRVSEYTRILSWNTSCCGSTTGRTCELPRGIKIDAVTARNNPVSMLDK